jgi:hypothetical protein
MQRHLMNVASSLHIEGQCHPPVFKSAPCGAGKTRPVFLARRIRFLWSYTYKVIGNSLLGMGGSPFILVAMEDNIRHCAEALEHWLEEHAPKVHEEQAHLDEGSDARAYWNYGYLMALRDVLNTMDRAGVGPRSN